MSRRMDSLSRWLVFVACLGLILWVVSGPSLAQDGDSTDEPAISAPTDVPTDAPTEVPPTDVPTDMPTDIPTDTPVPTDLPPTATTVPTDIPTDASTETSIPTTEALTDTATDVPTSIIEPTRAPTEVETTAIATVEPTEAATAEMTVEPTQEATAEATLEPTPEVTETTPSDGALTLIFSDNFTSGAASDWTLTKGWTVGDDDGNAVLRDEESSGAAALSALDRYSIIAQAQVRLDGGVARLSVRQSDGGAYTAALGANDTLDLFRDDQLVAATGLDGIAGDWHTLRLSAIDGDVTVSVDGDDVLDWTDDDPLPPGSVAFSGQNADGLALDNVQVWVPSDAPLMTAMELASPQDATIFTVNTTDTTDGSTCEPSGCTLIQAVNAANATSGATIQFAIPGDGPFVISLSAGLHFTQSVTLDATTQDGYDGTPLVELRASTTGIAYGIDVENGATYDSTLKATIKGLAITGFDGPAILLGNGANHDIEDNWIGVTVDGDESANNKGILIRANNSTISDNEIANNTAAAIEMLNNGGRDSFKNVIAGNTIHGNYYGIWIHTGAHDNTIGGPDETDRNIISDNSYAGIYITDASTKTQIVGNYIGTDSSGTVAAPNFYGIDVQNSTDTTIGGSAWTGEDCVSPCNLISGNTNSAIVIESIPGNGNATAGQNSVIQGNYVGTNVHGTSAIANGNMGIIFSAVTKVQIGGSDIADGNVISGNVGNGLQLGNSVSNATVLGNLIGTTADGTGPLPNTGDGIYLGGASKTTIGGNDGYESNLIAYNHGNGIHIYLTDNGYSTAILGNSIANNGSLGIFIEPNASYGFPAPPTIAVTTTDITTFSGTVGGINGHNYQLDFFTSDTCDPSGAGEGQYWLGYITFQSQGTGQLTYSATLQDPLPANIPVTARITDVTAGVSSMFSQCGNLFDDVGVTFTANMEPVFAGTTLTYTATVSNVGGRDAGNVRLSVGLPDALSYVSAVATTGSGTCQYVEVSAEVRCHWDTIAPGVSIPVTIVTVVNPNPPTSFATMASLYTGTPDTNQTNNSVTVNSTSPSVNLALTNSDSPDPVTVGGTLRYTLKASNVGPNTAPSTVITDTLPAGVTFIPGSSSPGCAFSAPTVTCSTGSLTKNATATVNIDVSVNIGTSGTLTNTATVSSPAHETASANNSATTTTKVNQPPTPGKVTQLTADKSATNLTRPVVSWTALTGGGSPFTYDVQFATNSAFTTGLQNVTGVLTTSVSPTTDFAPGTVYWRVRAVNVVHAPGPYSAARLLTIDTVAPTAPTLSSPADGAQVSSAKPALSYSAPSGASKYLIDISANSSFTPLLVDNGISTSTTFTPGTSLAQGRYSWRVQAADAAGNVSDESSTRSFVVFIGTSPTNGAFVTPKPTFNWTSVSGSTGYTVQIATDTAFTQNLRAQTAAAGKTSVALSSALAGGTYYWRVLSSFDTSPSSVPYRMMLVGTATAPTPLSPADKGLAGSLTPTVSWSAVNLSGITTVGYQVQTATDNKFTKSLATYDVPYPNTSQVLAALTEGSARYWRVKAIFADSTSGPFSAARSFTVDVTPPGIPTLSSPLNNTQTTSARPTLTWTAPSGTPTHYQVDVASDAGFSDATSAPATSTSLAWGTSLSQGIHYWRVKALDAANNPSAVSATGTFAVFIGTAPANGVFVSATPTFTWAAVTGATYRLQVADNTSFTSPVIDQQNLTGTSLVSPAIPTTGTYYWRVLTNLDDVGDDIGYRTIFVGTAPAAPAPTAPADKATLIVAAPQLSWTVVTPPNGVALAGYEVQVATDNKFSKGVQPNQFSNTNALTLAALPAGTYYWHVRAVFGTNAPGAWNTTVRSFKLSPAAPALSSPSNNSTTTAAKVKLSWKSVSGATQYEVRLQQGTNPPTTIVATSSSTSYTPAPALPGGIYYWQVIAIDSAGNRSPSTVWKFTVTG